MERLLVLTRHGQSEFNRRNLFTGWRDPDLTERGIAEAEAAGRRLKREGFSFDVAFTSVWCGPSAPARSCSTRWGSPVSR